jgi:effector-binding domain-containing protein
MSFDRPIRTDDMDPTLEQRHEQPYASIAISANFQEWGAVNALIPELLAWLGDREPAGAPFFRHRVIGGMTERFELEVGIPVTDPVTGDGRVQAGSKPAGTYVVLTHEAHPDSIAASHAALVRWADEHGIELARTGAAWDALFESYLTNPEEEPNQDRWRTELAYLTRQ